MGKRKKVWQKTDGHCAYCGKDLRFMSDGWHIEHIVPKLNGGSDGLSNLVPACRKCNHAKGTRSLSQFRRDISRRATELASELDQLAYFLNDADCNQFYNGFGLILELLAKRPQITFYMEQQHE